MALSLELNERKRERERKRRLRRQLLGPAPRDSDSTSSKWREDPTQPTGGATQGGRLPAEQAKALPGQLAR